MSEMVERVARAMCDAAGEPWDALSEDDSFANLRYVFPGNVWRGLARVAITAMIEPTEAMIEAGCWYGPDPRARWIAMIRVALEKGR